MKGASCGAASFISHAGSMSREHYFAGDEVMTLMTSSVVIGRNSHMPGVWQLVKVASLAQYVDARISAILFSMWSWYVAAEKDPALVVFLPSPSSWFIDCHTRR